MSICNPVEETHKIKQISNMSVPQLVLSIGTKEIEFYKLQVTIPCLK